MSLRLILLILSLLTFISASSGGYLYYSSLQDAAFKEGERRAAMQLATAQKNLSSTLSENIKPVRTLAGMGEIRQALASGSSHNIGEANRVLDHFTATLIAEACYLMDDQGLTIASSNRRTADSFVGKNFSFRPYFQDAILGKSSTYLALGITSGKRGIYSSHPVFISEESDKPMGAVVIKASIERIEKELILAQDDIILVTDSQGVVFISNRPEWHLQLLDDLTKTQKELLSASRQFGGGPWQWTGLQRNRDKGPGYLTDKYGITYLMHQVPLENYNGWQVLHLNELSKISKILSDPLIRITRPIITLCIIIGAAAFLLYSKASTEIIRRKAAESALRVSEKRYRSLYNNTPAMLHSIDREGNLLSVSDHWLEVMGFEIHEVLGQKLTKFYTEESRLHAEEHVIPDFFKNGICLDVPYQFVKKNGQLVDVLLSATCERNNRGEIIKSLAVSVDVTERKKAEEALKQAKEELSLYSRDLEKQVRKRTREINSILTNTPDVVYIKDIHGRFTLINKRFTDIFAISATDVHHKTDHDIFAREFALQFITNDKLVLAKKAPIQVEERLPQEDGIHPYLSVKFPILDGKGAVNGVCSISTDVTALHKAQAQLRRLSASIMENQEKERAAVSRELHDELGQVLTALRMEAISLQDRLSINDTQGSERVARMCSLIDATIDEVRGLAFRLRPGALDDLGLIEALEWYAGDFERRMGISCFFKHKGQAEIITSIATAAYRITQEALTNVARHAQANHVDVSLDLRDDQLILSIIDQGQGFSPEILSENEGLGLVGMRERASLSGGTLEVSSSPGQGVAVLFTVPLDKS